MISRILRRLRAITEPKPVNEELSSFQCNVCGHYNRDVSREVMRNREAQSCQQCRSSLRMRSVMHALSMELYGKAITLPEFERNREIKGAGMSDWDGYAIPLAEKLGYVNTYYHQEPKLDIVNITEQQEQQYDFIISTDVFEHIPPPVSIAFTNAKRLLKPGGVLIFTVPYKPDGITDEHFPNLHNFRLESRDGTQVLINETKEGEIEEFEDLIFHGGDGFTLEMRLFAEASLLQELEQAGFSDVKIYKDKVERFGIDWPISWALPIAARTF